jgi:hypothetical protein
VKQRSSDIVSSSVFVGKSEHRALFRPSNPATAVSLPITLLPPTSSTSPWPRICFGASLRAPRRRRVFSTLPMHLVAPSMPRRHARRIPRRSSETQASSGPSTHLTPTPSRILRTRTSKKSLRIMVAKRSRCVTSLVSLASYFENAVIDLLTWPFRNIVNFGYVSVNALYKLCQAKKNCWIVLSIPLRTVCCA